MKIVSIVFSNFRTQIKAMSSKPETLILVLNWWTKNIVIFSIYVFGKQNQVFICPVCLIFQFYLPIFHVRESSHALHHLPEFEKLITDQTVIQQINCLHFLKIIIIDHCFASLFFNVYVQPLLPQLMRKMRDENFI